MQVGVSWSMSVSSYILESGRKDFEEIVLNNSHKGPVLVNYWAKGAGPCLRLWPILEKLAEDYSGKFLLVNVNTDKENSLAREYGVNSVPTVKVFVAGEAVEQVHGAESEQHFRHIIDRYVGRDSDIALADAVKLYQQGEIEAALGQIQQLIFLDPENPRIIVSLAKLLIREQRFQQAYELLEKTPLKDENREVNLLLTNAYFLYTASTAASIETLKQTLKEQSDDPELWLQLSSQYMMHSDYDEAMNALLVVVKLDRDYRNGIAGRSLRGIFTLLGSDNASVKEYRQKLMDA